MRLLRKADLARLPGRYQTDGHPGDTRRVPVKFFAGGSWSWYALEFDPIDRVFFGLVVGLETELGYFSLAELESVGAERDKFWNPRTTLAEVESGAVR